MKLPCRRSQSFSALLLLLIALAGSASAMIDKDGDGMSDIWEAHFGLSVTDDGTLDPSGAPDADRDGDGWSNLQESIAGTDPNSGASPGGILQVKLTADPLQPGRFVLSWPTASGKLYTLFSSPDPAGGTWTPVGDPLIGEGTAIEVPVDLSENLVAGSKRFWRVSAEDIDQDQDGLTDYEEGLLGTNPVLPDTDNDGLLDGEEVQAGLDPFVPNPTYVVGGPEDLPADIQKFVARGELPKNVPYHQQTTFTIPHGDNGYLFLFAVHSEEFPVYTRNQEENSFNDSISWTITLSNASEPITYTTTVNDLHSEWIADLSSGESLFGFAPAHYFERRYFPPSAVDVTLTIDVTITNIADGTRPTTALAALVPISFKTYANTETGPGKAHLRNLPHLGSDDDAYNGQWKKCVAIDWDTSKKLNIVNFLDGQIDAPTRTILQREVKWEVNDIPQSSHEMGYGDELLPDTRRSYFVKAKIRATGETADRQIFTVIPPSTRARFDDWYNTEKNDMTWLADLPAVYGSLATGETDPEPPAVNFWQPPLEESSRFHPGSAFSMKSNVVSPGGYGHEARYNTIGALVTSGVAAGFASRYSPVDPLLADDHRDNDVKPYIWAMQLDGNPCEGIEDFSDLNLPMLYEGGFLKKYLEARPPCANAKPVLTPGSSP